MSMHAFISIIAEGAEDYGPLAPVVIGAGWLVSATVALGLAWRGRTNWEPAEEDLSRGPAKVAGVICAVILGLLWVFVGQEGSRAPLGWVAALTAVLTLLSLVTYGYLIAVYVFDKVVSDAPESSTSIRIVGGFRLTKQAVDKQTKRPELTVQDLLKGGQYEPDRVWPRESRALAKATFTLSYIILITAGTIALAATAMLLIPRT